MLQNVKLFFNYIFIIKQKSPSVETERPLTIACHMKNLYSIFTLDLLFSFFEHAFNDLALL